MNIAAWYRRMLWAGACLALVVVVLGAYVRLSDAGLGCPDWPGCYGHLILPGDGDARAAAQTRYPERLLESGKAWREMVHRYAAATLGLCILLAAALAWVNRRDPAQPVALPLVLLGVVIFQGLLGKWTVTLLLKPLVVMGHLLGGLTTLGLLAWLLLEGRQGVRRRRALPGVLAAGLLVLIAQIALGGWTSANYAALACPDIPTCQGAWWPPQADFAEGFILWRGLGINYEFGVLEAPARVAIHFTHRLGALVTFLVLGGIGLLCLRRFSGPVQGAAVLVIGLVTLQVAIGIGIVWFGLPLPLATAHNAGAALLLLAVLNLAHATRRSSGAAGG